MKNKRLLALCLSGILSAGMLTGCGGSAKPAETAAGTEAAKETTAGTEAAKETAAAGKAEVKLWHYYTTANGENFEKMIEEYNQLPEGKAKVTLELIPRNELLKKYTLGVATGQLPDIAIVDNPDTASFAAMGMFIDISDKFSSWEDNQFLEGPLKSGQYKDIQYALPLRSNCLALWANEEHLKAAGVEAMPETWEDLLAVCEKLKAVGGNAYPLAFSAVKSEEGVFQFMPFYQSTGATINEADSEAGIKAFTLLSDLAGKQYISSECINWTQGDVEKQFAAGNASMMIGGCWQIPNLAADAPDMGYQIGYIPKESVFSTSMGGENIGITKSAEDVEACWDFLTWILETDNNVRFNTLGGAISPHSNVTPQEQYPDSEDMQIFIEQFNYALARGPHPKWSEVSGAFQEGIQQTLTGAKTPEEAAKEVAAKVKTINESVK